MLNVKLTDATADIILGPPDAPRTSITLSLESVMMVGDIDDMGRAPGLIRLYLDGTSPYIFGSVGFVEKSSIWSFNIIPVDGDIIPTWRDQC